MALTPSPPPETPKLSGPVSPPRPAQPKQRSVILSQGTDEFVPAPDAPIGDEQKTDKLVTPPSINPKEGDPALNADIDASINSVLGVLGQIDAVFKISAYTTNPMYRLSLNTRAHGMVLDATGKLQGAIQQGLQSGGPTPQISKAQGILAKLNMLIGLFKGNMDDQQRFIKSFLEIYKSIQDLAKPAG